MQKDTPFQKVTSTFPEIDDLRKDLSILKKDMERLQSDSVALGKHAKEEGVVQLRKAGEVALDGLSELKKTARNEYHNVEKQVKANPGQSVAIAFAAGLVASLLLRGRR